MSGSDAPASEPAGGSTRAYRVLTHTFTVRTNDPEIGRYVAGILARMAIDGPLPPGEPTYEVLDTRSVGSPNRYRLLVRGRWINGSSDPSHVLDDLFSHINVDAIAARDGLILVHAGSVVAPAGAGVVIPASSGSGKSTLVAGLVRAGFGYLSDEAAVFEPATGALLPYPKQLTLKAGARRWFPETRPDGRHAHLAGEAWHADPDVVRPGAPAPACTAGFVLPFRYQERAPTTAEPLTPAGACVELGRNLLHAHEDAVRALPVLARVCEGVRAWRIVSGDLDEAVRTVAELTSS